jgi:hypothetical protein
MTIQPSIYKEILFGFMSPWQVQHNPESELRILIDNHSYINQYDTILYFKTLVSIFKKNHICFEIDDLPDEEKIANLAKFQKPAETLTYFNLLSIPAFYDKNSKFYYYLIINESIHIRAAIADKVLKSELPVDAIYQVYMLMNNLQYLIENISDITLNDKLSLYVINAIKLTLFSLYEEMKLVYREHIIEETLSEFEIINLLEPDFETQKEIKNTCSYKFNQYMEARQTMFVSENKPIFEKSKPAETTYNSFTYKNLNTQVDNIKNLYDALITYDFIDQSTHYSEFKKVFTGEPIKNPVIWNGYISDLNYFIKVLHNINKSVIDVKRHIWEVTCKCFIKPDGSLFDRANLKGQKKPTVNLPVIEKVASHLK